MDERNCLEPEIDDGSSEMQRVMIFVVCSLILVTVTTLLEIRFASWPLGIAGGISILIGGIIVAAIPTRFSNRIWAFLMWLFLILPIWFPFALHLACAWRQLCF